jgi:hypothetical protein
MTTLLQHFAGHRTLILYLHHNDPHDIRATLQKPSAPTSTALAHIYSYLHILTHTYTYSHSITHSLTSQGDPSKALSAYIDGIGDPAMRVKAYTHFTISHMNTHLHRFTHMCAHWQTIHTHLYTFAHIYTYTHTPNPPTPVDIVYLCTTS